MQDTLRQNEVALEAVPLLTLSEVIDPPPSSLPGNNEHGPGMQGPGVPGPPTARPTPDDSANAHGKKPHHDVHILEDGIPIPP